MRSRLGLVGLIGVIMRRPQLWPEALRTLSSLRRRRLPWPSRAYLHWRSHTAYGSQLGIIPRDLVDYLKWRAQMRRLNRWSG